MNGTVRHRYDRSVDDVFRLVTDLDFLKRRAEAAGEKNVVVRVDRDGSRMVIRIERDLERKMPGFMKKVFSPTNHLVDVQTWDTSGEAKTSEWTVEVQGQKRVEIRGRLTIAPAAGGCEYAEAFVVVVRVPLIGGQVEKYVVGETEASIREQIEFAARALAA